ARIGDEFVPLVERLGDLEGAAGGNAETVIGLALQGGEVVKARRGLGAGLLFFGDHGGRAVLAGGDDGAGMGLVPDAVDAVVFVGLTFFEVRPLVDAFVTALGDVEGGGNAPERTRLEIADFHFPRHDDGEGRRLHPADRRDVAGARAEHALGQGAGTVDADEPVAFAAAARGVFQ